MVTRRTIRTTVRVRIPKVRIPVLVVTCPHCYHRHELPGVTLATPGLVSCSRCGRTFTVRK